jgi:hypothetical protein
MRHLGLILWCAFFFIPLIVMMALDGFCSGRELCRAGLSFTLLIYAMGAGVFVVCVLIARLVFRAFDTSAVGRIRTLKVLFLIPLVPGLTILALLFAGLLGRLG